MEQNSRSCSRLWTCQQITQMLCVFAEIQKEHALLSQNQLCAEKQPGCGALSAWSVLGLWFHHLPVCWVKCWWGRSHIWRLWFPGDTSVETVNRPQIRWTSTYHATAPNPAGLPSLVPLAAAAAVTVPLVFCPSVRLCNKRRCGFRLTFKFHTHAQKEWSHLEKHKPTLVLLAFPRYLTPHKGPAQDMHKKPGKGSELDSVV